MTLMFHLSKPCNFNDAIVNIDPKQNSSCLFVYFLIAEARMRNKAMKREALQAAREAKKERGEYLILL